MNSEQSLDLWSDISLPQWMTNNAIPLIQNHFSNDLQKNVNKNKLENHIFTQQQKNNSLKRDTPVENQSPELIQAEQIDSSKASQSLNLDSSEKLQKDGQGNLKNKMQRRCQNSRKYRQRKRQYFKSLQEENKLLKSKVDQLTFKLNEKEREISRLKHNDPRFTQNFDTAKSQCLKQVEQMLRKNEASFQQFIQADNKLKKVLSFDSKQKLDYLNYFMSELLQNVINDRTFYFMDCLINKRGVHRQSEKQELRKIDVEVLGLLNVEESKIKQSFIQSRRIQLAHEASRLKQLWKKLYQVYLAILNQGMRLQRIVEPMRAHLMSFVHISNFLRVELHFEKNKYRPDIRFLRNSWFKQLQYQSINGQKQMETQGYPTKKTKFQ